MAPAVTFNSAKAIVFVWVEGLFVRITHYGDIDKGRAAAERLAESMG